jgi:hypothetical protein
MTTGNNSGSGSSTMPAGVIEVSVQWIAEVCVPYIS